MQTVTVSPKFQVVIPSKVRTSLDIQAGEKLEVIPFNGRIELIPVREMKSMRGFLKGINTTVERDEDRV
jgi:AbrB family looped-hinge helix DNA binding protein